MHLPPHSLCGSEIWAWLKVSQGYRDGVGQGRATGEGVGQSGLSYGKNYLQAHALWEGFSSLLSADD